MEQEKKLLWQIAATGIMDVMVSSMEAIPHDYRAGNTNPHQLFDGWLVVETYQPGSLGKPIPVNLARQVVDMVENYEYPIPNIRDDYTPPTNITIQDKDITCDVSTKLDSVENPYPIELWVWNFVDFTQVPAPSTTADGRVVFKDVEKGTYVLAADDGNSLPSNFLTVL